MIAQRGPVLPRLGSLSSVVLVLALGACGAPESDPELALRASWPWPTDPHDVVLGWDPPLTATCRNGDEKQRRVAYTHEYESGGRVFDCKHVERVLTVCRPRIVPETGTQWQVVQRTRLGTTCKEPVYFDITTSCIEEPHWCYVEIERNPTAYPPAYSFWSACSNGIEGGTEGPIEGWPGATSGEFDTDGGEPWSSEQPARYAWDVLQDCRSWL